MSADAIAWLFGLEHLGMKFGLENITRLLDALGNPHRSFPSVLIAGTNGKGSVTAVVDTALRHARYRSARYTSPHLSRLEERFVIDGAEVEPSALAGAAARVRHAAEHLAGAGILAGSPTFFEATTAIAFELFRAAAVDLAVVEVGLGGRLDSTNVLEPRVTAITTIAFDHQAQLGNTLESIAAEKAGIIKPGVPVVLGVLPPSAEDVVRRIAAERGAPLVGSDGARAEVESMDLALPGAHQRDNAAVALTIIGLLRAIGYEISAESARFALEHVRWPGRLEHMRRGDCDVLLDAAHNPAGAQALACYLQERGWTDVTLLFGAMRDKDIDGMLRALYRTVGRIIVTTADSARAADARDLAGLVRAIDPAARVEVIPRPLDALDHACATSRRVVIAGSMFLIGPLRDILR